MAKTYISPFACDTESAAFQALKTLEEKETPKDGWHVVAAFIDKRKDGMWCAVLWLEEG